MKMKVILKRWINLPARGWYSGDIHTHHPLNTSAFRDYSLQLAEAEDLHVMNVLQMGDRSDVYFQPQGYGRDFRISRNDITIATGQEEPRSIYGHIIGLNIDTLARDTSVYNHYDVVFDRLHKNPEALVGFAHFAYAGEGVTPGLAMYAPTGAIDFLEMMQNTRINTRDYYDYLNLGFRFAAAYGSDFPWGSIPGDGRVFVYTGHPFSADKWFAGLKAGHTFVSNGPALFLEADGMMPGSQIIKKTEQRSSIRVKGLSDKSIGIIDTIRLIGSEGVLFEKANPLQSDSIGFDFAHVVKKSQWVAAMVHCSNGAVAHTSPVYYVVDGQSTYNRDLGPAIIEKLVALLNKVRMDELSKGHADSGILSRVDTAIAWYKALLKH
jgi:hypothetical protein